MNGQRRSDYLKTVSDAVQPSTGSLRRELQDVLGFLRWDLFAHDLAGGHFAHFEGDQGASTDLTRPINARYPWEKIALPQHKERRGTSRHVCTSLGSTARRSFDLRHEERT